MKLNEVNIKQDRYIRNHGKPLRVSGTTTVAFTNKQSGDVNYKNEKEFFASKSGNKSDIFTQAKEWAKKNGYSTIYIMENKNIKLTKTQLREIIREELNRLNEVLKPTMATVGGVVYVDTDFVQASSKYGVLESAGMGDFNLILKGYPNGTVRYVRVNQKFDGFTGRAHKVLGDPSAIKFILKNMKAKKI